MRLAALAAAMLTGATAAAAQEVPLTEGSVVRFATAAEGREALAERDAFLDNLGPLERQLRVGTEEDVSDERFVAFLRGEVLDWPAEAVARIGAALGEVREKIAPLKLRFPETVLFVLTTGREEGDAAYCRGAATVVFSRRRAASTGEALEHLLLHELFHIFSRNHPELREPLYATLGFRPCPRIELPVSIRPRRLTNPDAPTIDCSITLEDEGRSTPATPVFFASIDRFDPARPGPFFRFATFRLMAVEQVDGRWRAVERDGQPVLIDPAESPSYAEQIGRNTGYIIHPEEILADNFVHLVRGKTDLPTPRIVESMRAILAR